MKINKIKFQNFKIYKGENEIFFSPNASKNISIIAGKNGFGKTTFLTSLIWVFYGKMMSEVEDKYKKDIKNAGGYEKFIKTILNREVKTEYENNGNGNPIFSVEIELKDILIPSIPCKSVVIKRSYNLKTDLEDLKITIDGLENELTKEVGFEVFINDFILPREIAKFFFFDAEKIVSLAEAKSKSELRNLSKAYSEVLGIKKYEDLKKNLETLVTKLRRSGASPLQQTKLFELTDSESELNGLIELNQDKQVNIDREIANHKINSDSLQEKLIREGNGITLEELQKLKSERDTLKEESAEIKNKLKKLMDIAPLVIAGKKLVQLKEQLDFEQNANNNSIDKKVLVEELNSFSNLLLQKLDALNLDVKAKSKVEEALKQTISEKEIIKQSNNSGKVLLDYSTEQFRNFEAVFNNIKGAFSSQFNSVVQEEKNNRIYLSKTHLHEPKEKEHSDYLESKRLLHKNAYLPWTKEDDSKLEELYKQRKSKNELCDFFGRNSGAINARIQKLELEQKYNLN